MTPTSFAASGIGSNIATTSFREGQYAFLRTTIRGGIGRSVNIALGGNSGSECQESTAPSHSQKESTHSHFSSTLQWNACGLDRTEEQGLRAWKAQPRCYGRHEAVFRRKDLGRRGFIVSLLFLSARVYAKNTDNTSPRIEPTRWVRPILKVVQVAFDIIAAVIATAATAIGAALGG